MEDRPGRPAAIILPVAISVREFGFEPPPPATDRGRPSLLVLAAAPPPQFPAATRIILRGWLVEGDAVARAARECGVPVPLLPPLPARDARRLRDLLTTRGVRAEVHPLGTFRRVRVAAGSSPAELEEALSRALDFADRAGAPAGEMPKIEAVLRESVANAVHHGNRDDPAKQIRIDLVLVGTLMTLAVEDDGPGFDHGAVLDELARAGDDALVRARERAAAGRRGGLGLLMIRRWADAVAWERQGRRIRVTKQLG